MKDATDRKRDAALLRQGLISSFSESDTIRVALTEWSSKAVADLDEISKLVVEQGVTQCEKEKAALKQLIELNAIQQECHEFIEKSLENYKDVDIDDVMRFMQEKQDHLYKIWEALKEKGSPIQDSKMANYLLIETRSLIERLSEIISKKYRGETGKKTIIAMIINY